MNFIKLPTALRASEAAARRDPRPRTKANMKRESGGVRPKIITAVVMNMNTENPKRRTATWVWRAAAVLVFSVACFLSSDEMLLDMVILLLFGATGVPKHGLNF
jgi:hypothetical protein